LEERTKAGSGDSDDDGHSSDDLLLRVLDREFPLGFSTGDASVDRALVAVRMVHLRKLELQQQAVPAPAARPDTDP
jgi:hypothetical protein